MPDLQKAKDWLQSRSITCEKKNFPLIKNQIEVIAAYDVMAVLEMLEKDAFDQFIEKMEQIGYKPRKNEL